MTANVSRRTILQLAAAPALLGRGGQPQDSAPTLSRIPGLTEDHRSGLRLPGTDFAPDGRSAVHIALRGQLALVPPGWLQLPVFSDAYRKRDYRMALENALKITVSP